MKDDGKSAHEPQHTDLPLTDSLTQALALIFEKAKQDAELADALRIIATAILDQLDAEDPYQPEVASDIAAEAESAQGVQEDVASHGDLASTEDINRLVTTFSSRRDTAGVADDDDYEGAEFDPDLTPKRLRLKAEASWWVSQHGYTSDPRALSKRNELIEKGKKLQAFLWMLDPRIVNPLATERAALLAANFETVEEALELWQRCEGEEEETAAVQLLAEAQSALRAAIVQTRSKNDPLNPWFDPDQRAVFQELRAFAGHMRMYVSYLTLDEPADPQAHAERRQKIEAVSARVENRLQEAKRRRERLNRLKYHASRLHRGSHNIAHDVQCLDEAVRELVSIGLAESALEFDELLRPILQHLGEDTASAVLQRVIRFIREREASGSDGQMLSASDSPTPEVKKLAQLLGGKKIVMIGGRPRKEAIAKIEQAFATEVIWPPSVPHQSHYDFKPMITNEEVGLVLLLIRWSSHSYAAIEALCKAHGKLLVRVPGGYNVNSLANAVLAQVGKQLIGSIKD
jgi:hypothetical protein